MKSLTKCVAASFILCIAYTIATIALECKGVTVSDTLTQYFFTTFGIEFAAAAAIKITKSVVKKNETNEKLDRLKRENITVERNDISYTSDDDTGGIYYG